MPEKAHDVKGFCPMGCGQTLFLADGGYITCSHIPCPDRAAVSTLLEDSETQHIVVFDEDGFTIRHPLRERLSDELLSCRLHNYCASLDGPPRQLGRYRARASERGWTWESLSA
jgi:Family of unknown function (DUF6085)